MKKENGLANIIWVYTLHLRHGRMSKWIILKSTEKTGLRSTERSVLKRDTEMTKKLKLFYGNIILCQSNVTNLITKNTEKEIFNTWLKYANFK